MTDTTAATAAPVAAPAPVDSSAASALTSTPAAPASVAAVDAAAAPVAATPAPVADKPPSLEMPGKDATPEQWGEFYKQLGRPDKPEEYNLPVPEGEDGVFAREVSPLLHKAGLSATQARTLAEGWNQMRADALATLAQKDAQAAQAAEAKNKAEEADLKREWGERHTENVEMARRAVAQFLPKDKAGEVVAAIEKSLGYAGTVRLMNSIGAGLGEHGAAGLGANNAGAPKVDPADVMFPTTAKK